MRPHKSPLSMGGREPGQRSPAVFPRTVTLFWQPAPHLVSYRRHCRSRNGHLVPTIALRLGRPGCSRSPRSQGPTLGTSVPARTRAHRDRCRPSGRHAARAQPRHRPGRRSPTPIRQPAPSSCHVGHLRGSRSRRRSARQLRSHQRQSQCVHNEHQASPFTCSPAYPGRQCTKGTNTIGTTAAPVMKGHGRRPPGPRAVVAPLPWPRPSGADGKEKKAKATRRTTMGPASARLCNSNALRDNGPQLAAGLP